MQYQSRYFLVYQGTVALLAILITTSCQLREDTHILYVNGINKTADTGSDLFADTTDSGATFPPGVPIYVTLPYNDPSLLCCYRYSTLLCGNLDYGGRRDCTDSPIGGTSLPVGNPYTHELHVIDGCPTYVAVGTADCQPGVDPRP